jgi:ribosomal protein S18 acetylase RimI-like enzyme
MLSSCDSLTPEVSALLALAMFPGPERVRASLEQYAGDPDRHIWIWTDHGNTVCAAGMLLSENQAELLHIGTSPQARGQGFGRSLLLALLERLELESLEAETDNGSVEFYRRCGFLITPIESQWGMRYRCLLRASDSR